MSISLDDLDLLAAADRPFEFEYITARGEKSGIFLQVLGANSAAVTKLSADMENQRRHKDALDKVMQGRRRQDTVEFRPIEDDVTDVQKLQAVRIVGWRGIKEPYTAELALKLCQRNPHLAAQAVEVSNDLGNFMRLSPATS